MSFDTFFFFISVFFFFLILFFFFGFVFFFFSFCYQPLFTSDEQQPVIQFLVPVFTSAVLCAEAPLQRRRIRRRDTTTNVLVKR